MKLADRVAIPIALDETVREIGPEELDSFTFAKAVVLKPALLGGMDVYRGWIDAAQRHGMQVVLTGAYESGVSTQRVRSEEHTSELQSRGHLVCRLMLEKKKLHNVTGMVQNIVYSTSPRS